MPLPPALALKLAKRGIINVPTQTKEPDLPVSSNSQEEIIAEDYDDNPFSVGETPLPLPLEKFNKFQGWFSCPNKWNVYHDCTPACQQLWKNVKEIDKEYTRCRINMLLKHPLPSHWQEILDVGVRRYYYWNTETDLVSWLPPGHPRCQVSMTAAQLRKQMAADRSARLREEKDTGRRLEDEQDDDDDEEERRVKATVKDRDDKLDNGRDSGSESMDEKSSRREKRSDRRERDRRGKDRPRAAKKRDELDPMDPASYSECPRGTWSSGLQLDGEARTGVDTTASGPLFQMRPYPNPGAILRANASSGAGPQKPP